MWIKFLLLIVSIAIIASCQYKRNSDSTIEERYLKLDTSYTAKEAFNDSICKVAVDSARRRFAKNRFELYVFYDSDSSTTPIQLLRSKFKMQTITFAREDFVFKFCYNDAMIAAYEERHHINPIETVTAIYDSMLRIGQTQKNPVFPGGFEALVRYMNCNLEYPDGEYLSPPYPSVEVRFTISPAGYPDKIEILKASTEKYNSAVLKLLQTMPRWSPPQDDYGKYDDSHVFQFLCTFDPNEKIKHCR